MTWRRSNMWTAVVAALFCGLLAACAQQPLGSREAAVGPLAPPCDTTVAAHGLPTVIRCIIVRPVITRRITEYPAVRFWPGDTVFVTAGGCVQTGWSQWRHRTWRDYVRPQGGRTGRLYFGTIWIPSVTVGAEPLRSVMRRANSDVAAQYLLPDTLVIPLLRQPRDTAHLFLRLGYLDDERGYADNSYSKWDEGYNSQCRDSRSGGAVRLVHSADLEGSILQCGTTATQFGPQIDHAWVGVCIIRHTRPSNWFERQEWKPADAVRGLRLAMPVSSDSARWPSPFDLVADSVDYNGFPLNPRWAWTAALGGAPVHRLDRRPSPELCENFKYRIDSTSWVGKIAQGVDLDFSKDCMTQGRRLSIDEGGALTSIACTATGFATEFHGHINWLPATYHGRIIWQNHFDDDDEDMDLVTPGYIGQTTLNAGKAVHVEFKASETVARFAAEWWTGFAHASPAGDSALINKRDETGQTVGTEAIVTGLFGLDAVHGGHAELHPVWALALHTIDDSTDDKWEIFVRNAGNEGSCSQDQHYLDLVADTFRLALPWRPSFIARSGAKFERYFAFDSVEVLLSASRFFSGSVRAGGPFISIEPGRSVVLSFKLPPPEERGVIHGELHLKWSALPDTLKHFPADVRQSLRGSRRAMHALSDMMRDIKDSTEAQASVAPEAPKQRAAPRHPTDTIRLNPSIEHSMPDN